MGTGPEVNVASGQRDQFGDAKTALDCDEQQDVVAPAGPGALVGCGEQSLDLRFAQVGHQRPVGASGWDRQDPGDGIGVLGVTQRSEAEQGVDGGQSHVAGAGVVAADRFQAVQKRADQLGVEVGQVQLRGWDLGPGGGEGQ